MLVNSDELNDALRITRSKFTRCVCGDELTDALIDRIINKLTNAEINLLDKAPDAETALKQGKMIENLTEWLNSSAVTPDCYEDGKKLVKFLLIY